MVDFCRLDIGKMLLFPEGKILSGTFYLDIYTAELTGHLKTDKGDLTFHAYTCLLYTSLIFFYGSFSRTYPHLFCGRRDNWQHKVSRVIATFHAYAHSVF